MKGELEKRHGYTKTKELFTFDDGLAEHQSPFLVVARPLLAALTACHHLLAQGSGSVRTLSTLIGQMSHASQTGILVAPLHYRGLHHLHLQAVSHLGQARKVIVPLTSQAHKDLEWWVSEISYRLNGCPIQLAPINLTVWTDASKQGWGAAYQGISTGGHSSVEEVKSHGTSMLWSYEQQLWH